MNHAKGQEIMLPPNQQQNKSKKETSKQSTKQDRLINKSNKSQKKQ